MEPDHTHYDIQNLLGAYAIDAVSEDERRLVEVHIPNCGECSSELIGHLQVVALLGDSQTTAPTEPWARIEQQLAGVEPLEFDVPDTVPTGVEQLPSTASAQLASALEKSKTRTRKISVVLKLAASVVALALLIGVYSQSSDGNPSGRPKSVTISTATLYRQAVSSSGARIITLHSPKSGLQSVVVVTTTGAGFVDASAMAKLDRTQTYQLWGISKTAAISLGLLGTRPEISAFTTNGQQEFMSYAITVEPASGSVVPTQPPVVQSKTSSSLSSTTRP